MNEDLQETAGPCHSAPGQLYLSTLVFPVQYGSGQFLFAYTPDLQDGLADRLAKLAEETTAKQ
jgi:hypothetical protein